MKVVDFFSGCGGTSCGFRDAGCEIIAGIDSDENAASTFALNFPEATVFNRDIRLISTDALKPLIDNDSESLLFSACAPCQPFSKQNRQKKNGDKRARLLDEFSRFVKLYLPDYIFIENVPGIQKDTAEGSPLKRFLSLIKELGYPHPSIKVVTALCYGVPQLRPRLIILASRHEMPLSFPHETHGLNEGQITHSTVRDWIGDLPKLEAGSQDPYDPDHKASNLSPKNLERIRQTPEGGDRRNWPDYLQLECHRKLSKECDKVGHTDVYGRLSFDKPASALTTRCISYSNGRFGHPVQDRALSLREAACLQTFPRSFRFTGSLHSKARQVGNAVPPLLAKHFGMHFLEKDKEYKNKTLS